MASHGLVDSQLFRNFNAEGFFLCQSCFLPKGIWVMTSETDSDEVPQLEPTRHSSFACNSHMQKHEYSTLNILGHLEEREVCLKTNTFLPYLALDRHTSHFAENGLKKPH